MILVMVKGSPATEQPSGVWRAVTGWRRLTAPPWMFLALPSAGVSRVGAAGACWAASPYLPLMTAFMSRLYHQSR